MFATHSKALSSFTVFERFAGLVMIKKMKTKKNDGSKRGGRPPKDFSPEIGKIYNRLIIRAILKPGQKADHSGARKVTVECLDCGKKSVTRLENVRSGHTKTCGCAKKAAYLQHLTRQVAKLLPGRIAELWSARRSGLSRAQCAKEYRIDGPVLDHALRTYERHLDKLVQDDVGEEIHGKLNVAGATVESVAAELGLTAQAVPYLLKAARRTALKNVERIKNIVAFAKWVCGRVENRSANYKEYRRGELSFKELRRKNGQLVGYYAELYQECLDLLQCELDHYDRSTITEFVRLAGWTLDNRSDRLNRTKKQIAKEKQDAIDYAISLDLRKAA
jgi:hypothetical protein